ncbi:ABC transporter ATP-binding protein [Clostridium cellulovorans]|uniref:ABC transporter transmembrane region n=1 Tax=Clostridium cellulovorans (strain ATCC 35296 / DSM 3052 / OCM 3 / 743B) TaxID=573061 RepID=D9SSN8_CLOC7|nr:ABC transporter ATP-binding protein [Clostridium cellulovorans]ADL50635.1 ABC transporter transmembrane region [Clostridium cellulovorans 743B]
MKASLIFIFKYIDKKRWFFLGYFAIFLECLTPIIATLLQRDLIDKVFSEKQYQEFPKILALYAIFFFGPKLWFTVRKVAFFHIGYQLQMSLTKEFLFKIYDMPTAIFNKEHVGGLLNNIRNNIADTSDLSVNQILSESVKNILTVLFLAFSIANINFVMMIIVVTVAIIYYGLLHKFGGKTKEFAQQVREEKSNISIVVEESISSIREVIAFNRQDWQFKHYDKKFSDYFKAVIKQGLFKNKILFISDPFLYGTKLVAILFGGMGVISNSISLGEFVVGFTFVDQLVTELGQLFEQGLTGKRLEASVQCIESVMGAESVNFGSVDFNEEVESIQFKDVTFSYSPDSALVLNKLSMDFPIGKKIAIVGKSGSGKSTVAQLLIRAYSPDKGEVSINCVPINCYGKQYTDKISMVFQQPYFIPSTIKENLVFDKEYDKLHIENACKEMLCHDFIARFPKGYETQVGERGISLSGGQKQRLALTRAILKNTDVLILDEATSALDTETEFCVQKNIDKLRKGKTTIIIAHRISTIQNADIIYVLDKGTVVAQGTHEVLMSESHVYKELYALQQVG